MAVAEDAIWRQRVEDLFRHSPALLAFLAGPDHVYQLVSERFADLIGRRDIVGKAAREALPGLKGQGFAGEEYFALLDRVYATAHAFSGRELPVLVTRPDGTSAEHYFSVEIQPTYNQVGAVDGLLIQGMDVTPEATARQRVEHALAREQSARASADRAVGRLSRLQSVSAALSEALTPMEVMRVVVEQGSTALQASAASVAILTEGATEIEVVYAEGYGPDLLELYQRFPLDARVPLAVAIRSAAGIWIESSEVWAEQFPEILDARGIAELRSAVALPLLIEGRSIGGIGLSFPVWRTFDEEDRAFMSALAQQCAQALDRARLYDADHRQAALLDLVYDAIIVRDLATSRIEFWNQGAERLYGWTRDDARGQISSKLLGTQYPQALPEIEARVEETGRWEGELIRRARDGRRIVVSSRWALERTGGNRPAAVLEISTDITEQKEAQDALAHLALHDVLTGLPNRSLFQDRLHQAIQMHHRNGGPLALLVLDLVHFKEINDTFGHYVGDLQLRQMSDQLQRVLRASDTAARLGGDEFAVILQATDSAGAMQAAQKIAAALEKPVVLDGECIQSGANIGIALCPQHAEDESLLLRHADVAMYAAKRAGSRYALYDAEQDAAHRRRRALVGELRHAIDHDQLVLHFQPAINIKTGRSDRLEALVRWMHPERGLLLPDVFLTLAEETGLMEPLTLWVLRSALQACQGRHHREGGPCVAVNLSASSLRHANLVEDITGILSSSAIPASSLTLELTESTVMAEPERAMRILAPLHEMGVTIVIDDFGTGYSSLAYLKRLPVDEIKIDQSFVHDLSFSESDCAIVRSVIDLGHSLNRAVTAEGVEDDASYRLLASMGCDFAQGYHIAPPLPLAGLDEWFRTHQTSVTGSDRV